MLTVQLTVPVPSIAEVRTRVAEGWKSMRADHVRFLNPTPYKVLTDTRCHTHPNPTDTHALSHTPTPYKVPTHTRYRHALTL